MNNNSIAGANPGRSAVADNGVYRRIDHIAIAVINLEEAIAFYTNVLGFTLVRRLEIKGKRTGMVSAEMECNGLKFVLCQGTEPESQVSQLIANHGPGVAHIALEVDDVHSTVDELSGRGMKFDTSVIGGPDLQQAFTSRDKNSGMSFELIKRGTEQGFVESNVQDLFDQLEKSGAY
jgi:methylmalonyl-CoA/ethylmalonyl-CoA epimerase